MNPLLKPSTLKNAAVPFDLLVPEHFVQALDQAIYALESIRNRSSRGVSLDPGWQCSTIEDVASEALTTLTTLLVPEREAA